MQSIIQKAVKILQQGGLVAFPTETVYGLGADARNPEALLKIFQAKQRPVDHPLIVHLGDMAEIQEWAVDVSEDALLLAKTFWPGPLTLILKKAPGVTDVVTGGQDTIGLRIPNHPVALELLHAVHGGLAAPSANRFGRISPTSAAAVREELDNAVDLVLDGGDCQVGVESTIVDMTGEQPIILRPGMITAKQIEHVLKKPIVAKGDQKNIPRVSGSLESHYAPETKTVVLSKAELTKYLENSANKKSVVVLAREKHLHPNHITWMTMPNNAEHYAHDLYHTLREVDKRGFAEIIIEAVPETDEWLAIADRLKRAGCTVPDFRKNRE